MAGALVRLVDSDGETTGSFLTATDGRYRLEAPNPGSYTLLVERIGYESTRIGAVDVRADTPTVRNIVVAHRPIELEGLMVEGAGRKCDLRDEGGGITQVVWTQVRNALVASTWTNRERNLGFRILAWERRLSPGSQSILDEARHTSVTFAGNSVRSLPAEELAVGGYVRMGDDGMVEYYAPDAEALLSDAFLAEHCFSVRAGEGEEDGWVGLAFEPLADRDTADVSGTIWVERRSARLQRIDFRFVGLSYEVGTDLAGGRIDYAQLPDGRWIVEDWRIRAPAVVVVRSNSALGRRDRQMVDAVHETGAKVVSVRGTDFEWTPDRPTVTVRGAVFDSTAATPLSGAKVRIGGWGWTTESRADGTFEMSGLPEGRYRMLFEHPRLDSLGLGPRGRDVNLRAGSDAEVRLAIPSKATLLAETCPAELEGGVVVGWVTAPDGTTPVPGTRVAVESNGRVVGEATAGLDGSYRMCGVPTAMDLTVEARVGPMTSYAEGVRTDPGRYARADLKVSWSSTLSGEPSEGRVIAGTVRDGSNGRPLAAATVEVVDGEGTPIERMVTDAAGNFRVVVDSERAVRLRFASLGYGRAESGTIPAGTRRHRVQVELAPEALAVEGVVVSVEGRTPALERVGFYDRMAGINGRFLEREQLGMESARRVSDALQRINGLQRFDQSSLTGNTTRQFVQFRSGTRASQLGSGLTGVHSLCMVHAWLQRRSRSAWTPMSASVARACIQVNPSRKWFSEPSGRTGG